MQALLLRILFILFFAVQVNATVFYTEDAGQSSYLKNGKLGGFSVEIVKEMIKRVGTSKDQIQLVPWARGYQAAQSEEGSALFAASRTAEREKLFKWVGPLNMTRVVLFAKKDYQRTIVNLDDAKKGGPIGCYQGDFRGKILETAGFKNLMCMSGDNPNLRNIQMLKSGRIDLWVTSDTDLVLAAKEAQLDPDDFKRVFVVQETAVNIAFHPLTPDSEIQKWQASLDAIKKAGIYKKIMTKYKIDPSIWAP